MTRTRNRLGVLGWLSAVLVGVPVAVARLIGMPWITIGGAYAIWLGALGILALMLVLSPKRDRLGETFGWMAILAFFWTVPAVAVLVALLKIAGVG